MDILPIVWFAVVAVLWTGYLLLEGFDLGVGMHMLVSARTDRRRRAMLNTIGPVWDGNEVWLVTAGAATFAAFPLWYASLLSALYLPLTVALLALILRAVSIEWRGKGSTDRWRRWWDTALGGGSFVAAFAIGAMLGVTTLGLPIDADGNRVGGAFAWFGWEAMLGGTAVVTFCLAHGACFLALRTDGELRERMNRFLVRWGAPLMLPLIVWVGIVVLRDGSPLPWALLLLAVPALAASLVAARRGRDGIAFGALASALLLGTAALFGAAFPTVLPSTLDPAFDLTVWNAASGSYTLGVMTVVAAFGLPIVLLYQGWTYWVFRKRVSESSIPAFHAFEAAVRRRLQETDRP